MEQTIGKRIAQLRKSRSMTQDQLAEQLGVSAQAVSKWENDISCPDISLLPKLAEIFQVTTDNLLGVPEKTEIVPAPPKQSGIYVNIGDEEDAEEEEKDGLRSGFTLQFDLGSKDLPWFAVAVLLFAVALLMNRTWLSHLGEAEIWNLMWPSALLAWGVSGLWKKITGWSVGLTLLGAYTLLGQMGFYRWIPVVKGGFLIPVVLILWAGSMLADHFRKGGRGTKHRGEKKEFTSHCAAADGVLQYEASFGDDRQAVDCEVFCGGKADVSFGNFSLDLTGCGSVRPGSVLELDVSFGQLTLYLPRTWRVQERSDRSFAAVTTHSAPYPDADQLLTICSDVSFASLDIRWD